MSIYIKAGLKPSRAAVFTADMIYMAKIPATGCIRVLN